jgi:hypothetical protein
MRRPRSLGSFRATLIKRWEGNGGVFWGSINLGEFEKIIVGFKMVVVVGKVIGDVLLGG